MNFVILQLRNSNILLFFSVISLFSTLAYAHFSLTGRFDLPLLIGDKAEAAFDLWSIQHFCAGILLGSVILRSMPRPILPREFILSIFLFALFWEAAELAMETGLFGMLIADWKGGFEHWSNRFFGDPFMVIGGSLISIRISYAWKIVLVPASIWLLLNVFAPTAMSIQNFLIHLFEESKSTLSDIPESPYNRRL